MARIPDQDRLAVVDVHIGHWEQADSVAGSPIEIVPGYGIAQLQADRAAYYALQVEIANLVGEVEYKRAQRDAIFGRSGSDADGVWLRLRQYKDVVRARLGPRNPLGRTVPDIGHVTPRDYTAIIRRFINHWQRVNAELDPDVTLGTFTLTDLQAAHDNLIALRQEIENLDDGELPLLRARREQMFGDVSDEMREETSIVARLMLYHVAIETTFPNQPLAKSLPDIFPTITASPSSRDEQADEPAGATDSADAPPDAQP